jgi:phytoene dehydrogenase-like protein
MPTYDAIIVGAGPNGLAAAIVLARAGWSVLVREGADTVGGGARSKELTLPGFVHDVCSAVHPLAISSPLFGTLGLERYGLAWVQPDAPLAHPLEAGAVVVERSVEATAARLGEDADAYVRLFGRLSADWPYIRESLLGPLAMPRHPLRMARFGVDALRPAVNLARARFRGVRARALFAGHAAHSQLPLERAGTAAFGMVLAVTAHVVGWPVARGGSGELTRALTAHLRSLGGEVVVGAPVTLLAELPAARAILCDVTPRQLLALAGDRLPDRYRRKLARYRYGQGVFKIDWALGAPIPWRDPECARAITVHVGGTLEEIAAAEAAPWQSRSSNRPFVLLAQPTLFDATRAPDGQHVAWAYCHVPSGSTVDMTEAIEDQVERFAPGFRRLVLARHVMGPADFERYNPNIVGGDINGGAQDLGQLFNRPTLRAYRTPVDGLYLCSSSTPPGGGVHGMCGFHAARAALADRKAGRVGG